jgi:hypothetical protein
MKRERAQYLAESLHTLIAQNGHGAGQRTRDGGLARKGVTDKHEAVSHTQRLKQLRALVLERRAALLDLPCQPSLLHSLSL